MDKEIIEKIKSEIEGKNPKKVLPAIKRNVDTQKGRVKTYIFMAITFITVIILGLVTNYIHTFIWWFSIILLPFQVLGIFADYKIYVYQKTKVQYLEELIEEKP